jgi:adenylate cyclase
LKRPNNLSRYFLPNLVEMLAERDEPLGAVRRENVAVLFADIVGFTTMAESTAPEAVVAMLREYHERMTAPIFACGAPGPPATLRHSRDGSRAPQPHVQ